MIEIVTRGPCLLVKINENAPVDKMETVVCIGAQFHLDLI